MLQTLSLEKVKGRYVVLLSPSFKIFVVYGILNLVLPMCIEKEFWRLQPIPWK